MITHTTKPIVKKQLFQEKLPNILTLVRIVIIPLIVVSFYLKQPLSSILAVSFFIIASVTDFFDGYLARAWSTQSKLGRFLDPIADKLLVVAVIMMLIHVGSIDGWQILPALLIVCREILVSGLREFLVELKVSLPVSSLGKFKTGFQMSALLLLLIGTNNAIGPLPHILGIIALWMAAILTIISGATYLKFGLRHMD